MALLTEPHKLRLYHDVLVRSNTETDDVVKLDKVTLFKDTSYDPHRSKRIYGEVVALPYRLRGSREHQEELIFPEAKGYFGGESIARQAIKQSQIYRRALNVAEEKKFRSRYSSGHYEPSYTLISDQPIQGKPGDRAYFHYLALSDESYMGQDLEHNRYYRVPYDTIFCFVRGGVTYMANGYMQVEPYWNEEYQEIEVDGKKVRGKLKGNLVIGLKEAPEFRTGTVVRRGLNYGRDTRSTIRESDIVIYTVGSEFKNTIEGKEVYLMKQWNIIAKREDNKVVPVGDYVHLRVKKRTGIIMRMEDVLEDIAEVISTGENCQYAKPGDKVHFNTQARFFNIDDTVLLREGQILARYES
jgi:co-chaperonin GroES (HSP10)